MISDINIEDEMKKSYLSYAMSVIISRALPDVRDGLKPVHRRALFAMQDLGNTHDKPYKKSARVVGEILGKYHPHGDTAVYDTIVRMAQPFSLRYMLVDGQGNFGSIDGDNPAAMRYTEVRMAKIAEEMLAEINEETVDFTANFDNTLQEPTVLPSKIPQLLINGSSGIAVAMVSNIPPHNLTEVADALIAILDGKPDEEAITAIQGPDFPTGGIITGYEGLQEAYRTGKGKITVLSKADVQEDLITVSEIPYMVTKTRIIEDIVNAVKTGSIEGISDVHDRSDRKGLSLEIKVKRGYNGHNVLQQLYEHTAMRTTFGIISIALVDKKPKVLPLATMLQEFLKFRRETIKRRTIFRLKKAEQKAHLLIALLKALQDVDKTIKIIKGSKDAVVAKQQLMATYSIDEVQAQAILEMRLQKIAAMETKQIIDDYKQTMEQIKDFKHILETPARVDSMIKQELTEIREKYSSPRRTQIVKDYVAGHIKEEAIVVLTKEGYIKRVHPSEIKEQGRGGVGVRITHNDLHVLSILNTNTTEKALIFTNKGRVFSFLVGELMSSDRYGKGGYIGNFIKLEDGELPVKAEILQSDGFLLFLTKKGVVKRVPASAFTHIRITGIRAITFREDDSLADVAYAQTGTEPVFISTELGQSIMFPQAKLRETGRSAIGVRGIRLSGEDRAVNISSVSTPSIMTLTSSGYGRFTETGDYRIQGRGGHGIINIKLKEKETVVFSNAVPKTAHLLITTAKGMVIKIPAEELPSYGRNTRGVRLMQVKGDEVSSVTVIE